MKSLMNLWKHEPGNYIGSSDGNYESELYSKTIKLPGENELNTFDDLSAFVVFWN